MVKRTPPLTIGLIGTGETSARNVEALLNDYTSTYAEVTAVLPVDDAHWTPTIEAAYDWITENDIPFVAVTDGSSPSKKIAPILEKADSTIKVARVSTKMVSLLQQEASEGAEVALMVAWDDDDAEASTAVTKALTAEVTALNLLDGLDPFEFDDEEQPAEEPTEATAGAPDEYDDMGVRKLRALLRERADEHDIPDRTIGTLTEEDARKALRNIDAGRGKAAPAEEPDEAQTETRTTRARRAFAEGASEGQDEVRPLPRSKGSDILETEDDDTPMALDTSLDQPEQAETTTVAEVGDDILRLEALELAIRGGKSGAEAIADAMKYEVYLKGQRQSAGRPRSDGTPAQPREIGEDGKPIRRRARSTE